MDVTFKEKEELTKKAVLGIILMLLLIGMLTLAFNIQPVKGWVGTVYIRADGSIDPPDAPITIYDNITYTLIDNITSSADGIVVERDNIVIDGDGYTLQGTESGYGFGVYLTGRNNVTIRNIRINAFIHGIYLHESKNNTISGNNLIKNEAAGITLMSSSNNTVLYNEITDNSNGIHGHHSSYNRISQNLIAENVYYGVVFYNSSSTHNTLHANRITYNDVGVWIIGWYNIVYHNNFIHNSVQCVDSGVSNTWDDGYPSGGNFWSDYTGVDEKSGPSQDLNGSDGIGDTPYVINAENLDRYPLMEPYTGKPSWEEAFVEPNRQPIVDFAVYNGSLYAAADNKLYVYDGNSWDVITAPTFLVSLEPYQNKLVVSGQGGLYSFDGATFSPVLTVPTYIKVLGVYNSTLYAGTVLANPPEFYYCNGSVDNPADWHLDTEFSVTLDFLGPFGSIDSFAVYDNMMYVGSGGTLYSFNGTGWSIAKSCNDVYAFLDMQVYNGKLYLATRDQAWRKPMYLGGSGFSGRVVELDGENWTTILDHDYWIFSLETYNRKLYVGTANNILTYNGMDWEVSFESTEDAFYAISMITHDGKIYAGMGNGYIFVDPSPEIMQNETIAIPEFSSFIFLPLFILATLVTVLIKRRKRVS